MKKIVSIIIILFIIIVVLIRGRRQEEEGTKMKKEERYALVVKEYLEQKYKEEFQVRAKLYSNALGSIPFSTPTKYFLFAYPVNNLDFRCIVYIKESKNRSGEIESIKDDYYWRFLHDELCTYFDQELNWIIGRDYQYRIVKWLPEVFGDKWDSTMPLKEYIEDGGHLEIFVYVFLPSDYKIEEDKMKVEIKEMMEKLYKSSGSGLKGYLVYFQVNDKKEYTNIDRNIYKKPNVEWIYKNTTKLGEIDFKEFLEKGE